MTFKVREMGLPFSRPSRISFSRCAEPAFRNMPSVSAWSRIFWHESEMKWGTWTTPPFTRIASVSCRFCNGTLKTRLFVDLDCGRIQCFYFASESVNKCRHTVFSFLPFVASLWYFILYTLRNSLTRIVCSTSLLSSSEFMSILNEKNGK